MIWYSKHPPIYCFPDDIWIREEDKKSFRMTQYCFESDDEKIAYTKKTHICKNQMNRINNEKNITSNICNVQNNEHKPLKRTEK